MKIKKIVGFGDSWMFGDELLDPALAAQDSEAHSSWVQNEHYRHSQCFLGLLGIHYDLPVENFGIAGGSLQSSIWTYLWWIEQEARPENCLVLVLLTEPDRTSFYNPNHVHYSNDPPWNKFVHSTWVKHGSSVIGSEYTDLIKRYIAITHDRKLSQLNYNQALLFFDGQSARKNIPLMQFHGAPPLEHMSVPTLYWPEFDWITHFRDHFGNQRRELIMPGGHPNELGHRIIRDLLIPELDPVILQQ